MPEIIVTGVANVTVYPPDFVNNPAAYFEDGGTTMTIYGENVVCVREQPFNDKSGVPKTFVVIDGIGGQSYILKEASYEGTVAALFNV